MAQQPAPAKGFQHGRVGQRRRHAAVGQHVSADEKVAIAGHEESPSRLLAARHLHDLCSRS